MKYPNIFQRSIETEFASTKAVVKPKILYKI